MIFLVHHAAALGPHEDPQRPLSVAGRMHADRLALRAAEHGAKPVAIWHRGSCAPARTAESTGAPVIRGGLRGPSADSSRMTPPTGSGFSLPVGEVRDVRLVGHMPSLPRILRLLTSGSDDGDLEFPLNGIVALEADGERAIESWRSADETHRFTVQGQCSRVIQ